MIRSIVFGASMLAAAGVTLALTPTYRMAEGKERLDLATTIPQTFSGWKIDPTLVPVAPAPDVQAALDKIYTQTLSRTYIDEKGRRMMLSVAYGADQSDSLRIHQPEGCYVGQGFRIDYALVAAMDTALGRLPIKQLNASKGARNEPITYWVVIGDKTVLSPIQQKFAQLGYGLTGRIPDGILVRVSSISHDQHKAFAEQQEFIRAMIDSLPERFRPRLVGQLSG